MNKKNFIRDLNIGKRGELIFVTFLEKHNIPHENNRSKKVKDLEKFDYKVLDKTFEVKYDIYEAKSGNVAIEYYNPKSQKSSGLSATTANFWTYILSDSSIWICETNKLKEYIKDLNKEKGFVKDVKKCGDGNSSSYIYKRNILFDNLFTRIDDLDRKGFLDVLNK